MVLSRFSTALSVRLRLIVLALVPVLGFAAIAFAYVASERAVEAAFGSVQQSARLADASRSFKEALTAMQMRVREFVATPQPGIATRFADAHMAATDSLKTIQELAGEAERQNLSALAGRVANLKASFSAITAEQENLGLSEFEGFQGELRDSGNTMERTVNDDMSWLSEADQRKILTPLMLARRFQRPPDRPCSAEAATRRRSRQGAKSLDGYPISSLRD